MPRLTQELARLNQNIEALVIELRRHRPASDRREPQARPVSLKTSDHLDAQYGDLVRKLVAKLARKRPSPLARGDLRIWAAAAIYAVGSVNFLVDRTQRPHLTGEDLSAMTGVPKSTIANKAKLVRDALRIGQMEPEFCRRRLLASNPMAWMILRRRAHRRCAHDAVRGPGGGTAARVHPRSSGHHGQCWRGASRRPERR